MRDFFNGWRRKVGCVALVVACAFMGIWLRSLSVMDIVAVPLPNRQHIVESVNGQLWWTGYAQNEPEWEFNSTTEHRSYPQGYLELIVPRGDIAQIEDARFGQWIIPYWYFAVPLTLLSAYLILWKPRKKSASA